MLIVMMIPMKKRPKLPLINSIRTSGRKRDIIAQEKRLKEKLYLLVISTQCLT